MKPAPKNILISEPQAFKQRPYLPYLWSVLKSYGSREGGFGSEVRWLDPIYEKNSPEPLLEPYAATVPDLVGLSCYTWNWNLQCRIAAELKSRNPNCTVVAGGPHPDYKDPEFFTKYPFIDAIAVKDGEITFSSIIRKLLGGESDLAGIPGLYLPGKNGQGHICTGPAAVPIAFDHSPYIDQSAYFERLVSQRASATFDVIWETNRGCPYSCNFCDWGSNTMSKVRKFNLDRVKAEIEWFGRMKIKAIILADANFGILPRDPEIADFLNEVRSRYGYPKFVHYSPAKNNPERTVEIARKFFETGISPVYPFAVQHTDENVLAGADRANISVNKQRQVAKAAVTEHIPTLVQLIVGIPGDTYDLWKTCLTDLMDWGLHDNYQIFNYTLLPNAPAADKSFRDQWQVETIARKIPQEGTGQRRESDADALTEVDLIVQSRTFSRGEWAKMKTYAAFIRALHNRGLTQLIAMYLHFTHSVSYRDFYDSIVEGYFSRTPLYQELLNHFEQFVHDERAFEDLRFDLFSGPALFLEASQWLFLQICSDFDAQFDQLKAYLLGRYSSAGNLGSAIDYQKSVVVAPKLGQSGHPEFRTDFDWVAYFKKAGTLTDYEKLDEPTAVPGATVKALDDLADFIRSPRAQDDPRLAWIELVREVRRTLNTNFQRLELAPNPLECAPLN